MVKICRIGENGGGPANIFVELNFAFELDVDETVESYGSMICSSTRRLELSLYECINEYIICISVPFVRGGQDTCSNRSQYIKIESVCKSAAGALQLKYTGSMSDRYYPPYCYLNKAGNTLSFNRYTANAGKPSPTKRPNHQSICQIAGRHIAKSF